MPDRRDYPSVSQTEMPDRRDYPTSLLAADLQHDCAAHVTAAQT